MLMMALWIYNIGIAKICGIDYRCIAFGIKDEAIKIMQNSVLNDKWSLKNNFLL